METILELRNIRKIFGGNIVLDNMNLAFQRGEVHALVGENGAGKSTIIKIISGVYQPDGGQIVLEGQPVKFPGPRDAQKAGISTMFQEVQEIPEMTVTENIFLGQEPAGRYIKLIDKKKLNRAAQKLMEDLGLTIDISKKMKELTVSGRKMVELVRAVSCKASVVIMDEPTANLNAEEIKVLFRMIDRLKQNKTTILYISHRMNEVFTLADRVTVLRDGRKIDTLERSGYDEKSLISLMIGRELTEMYPQRNAKIGKPVLSVCQLSLKDYFRNVSFEIKEGEVVGLAGLESSGATLLTKALFGLCGTPEGKVICGGEELRMKNSWESIRQHVAYVPEDRKTQGLFLNQNLIYNYTISSLRPHFLKRGLLDTRRERKESQKISEALRLKARDLYVKPEELSGGNQQKVLLGRWMMEPYRLLILEEPTRGVDVGAKAEIYHQINRMAEQGTAVLMYSTEMMELLGMCDRILVFSAGCLTAELSREEATQEKIMQYALVR